MKQSITRSGFAHLFEEYNRKENFSYNGRLALFDYLEELEGDTGEQIECDIIGFCCDFSEYETAEECAKEYNLWCLGPDSYEEREEYALEQLRDRTSVIKFEGGIIIQAF
tara:strand:+ start:720 stop:1049 length:330 start_codon:yes stop_codon:yes gene_type:complete